MKTKKITSHRDLEIYKIAFDAAMEIFELTKGFPKEEQYSLTDQIRRSSRSVCAQISEAFRKRKYEKSFISKIVDGEGEAAETQVWLEFSLRCGYIKKSKANELYKIYDNILSKFVIMRNQPDKWVL